MGRKAVWSGVVLLALGAVAPVAAQPAGASDPVVARVGDQEITLGEIEQRWREADTGSYMQVTQSRFDALDQYLDLIIGDRLLAIEAATRGISVEELLQQELPGRTSPVTDAEHRAVLQQPRQPAGAGAHARAAARPDSEFPAAAATGAGARRARGRAVGELGLADRKTSWSRRART